MKKMSILFLPLFVLMIAGCSENPVGPTAPAIQANKGVYVVNEGLYSQNNSSITFFDLSAKTATLDAFQAANGRSLGDTGNELVVSGKTGFITVNVSNKVEIIDINTFKSKGSIDLGAFSGPRRVWAKDSVTAYVTAFSGKVYRINASTLAVEKEITVGGFPEGIIEHNGKLLVANSGLGGGNTVSVIDLATESVVKTITVGTNPINMIKDRNNFIYTVCKGRYDSSNIGGAFYKIDPNSLSVTDSIIVTQNPDDAIVTQDNIVYVLNNLGIMKLDLNKVAPTPELVINGAAINSIYASAYALSYDPVEKLLYISNPKDYMQNGEVAVYDLQGNEIRRFGTGLNPGCITIVNY